MPALRAGVSGGRSCGCFVDAGHHSSLLQESTGLGVLANVGHEPGTGPCCAGLHHPAPDGWAGVISVP